MDSGGVRGRGGLAWVAGGRGSGGCGAAIVPHPPSGAPGTARRPISQRPPTRQASPSPRYRSG